MRNGEDWILDAMYVDPLRMRNKLSFELWEKMWDTKGNMPYYTTNPGIQCEYIELFINQRYMGLYCLSERLDERLIQLDSDQDQGGAVLYKAIDWKGGATAFKTYNSEPGKSMIWEGWEQVYPDQFFNWLPLAELRKSVILDSDEVFKDRIVSLIDLEAAVEYYLFINLILAHDNIIKNYFLAQYTDDSSFLLLPWDLEGSWGIMWDGDHSLSHGMLENGLYKRLMELDVEDFREKLERSWEQYRTSVFMEDSLTAPFKRNVDLLKRNGAIERENLRWPGAASDMRAELDYLRQWTALRLDYLDQVFD
jgi:spore coat protein CotH